MTRRFMVLGALLSMGCGSSPVHVTGTVTYRGHIALPAGAKIHVMLQDVSRLDASAATLAEEVIVADGRQTAFEFALACDSEINADHTYIVRAEVMVGDEKRFLSKSAYPVITRDRPTRATVVVESIWSPRIAPPESLVAGATAFVGAYSYMADAGLFTYCGTDARFPVALKGDNAALERAYGSVTHQPGAPVLVTLYGRLEPQMPMEGKLPQDHVIVDRFLQVWPDETCDKVAVEAPLAGTHWRLVELNGQPAAAHEGQEEAHFTLDAGAQRVSGFAGCNRFTGGYRQTGWNLRFSQLASTRMACPNSDDEQVFLKALESVTSYQILGGSLDLRAESGSVARFRAVTETSAGDPPGP